MTSSCQCRLKWYICTTAYGQCWPKLPLGERMPICISRSCQCVPGLRQTVWQCILFTAVMMLAGHGVATSSQADNVCCRVSRAQKAEHLHRAVILKKAWLIDAPVNLRQEDEWIKAYISANLQVRKPAEQAESSLMRSRQLCMASTPALLPAQASGSNSLCMANQPGQLLSALYCRRRRRQI